MDSITIDLGGTRIKIGIVSSGRLIANTSIDAFSNLGLLYNIQLIESEIEKLILELKLNFDSISGIGFSIPGIIDSKRMKLLSVNQKYNDAADFDFIKWAKEKYNLKVFLENDARCALVGEWKYGAGKGINDIVMVTLGTGIGGAALMEGKLLHGKHFQAGCLGGHFIIDFQGSECNCGNVGCVETIASSWKIQQLIKNDLLYTQSMLFGIDNVDYRSLFSFAQKDDKLSIKYLELSMKAWASCVINLVHAYDPEMVIIGGGIMKNQEEIILFIQKYVSTYAWTPWGKVNVVAAQEKDYAALLGAGYLLENYLKEEQE